MFGSWGEVAIIALAALVLIGPKELPVVLRALGRLRQKLFHVQESMRSVIDPYIHVGEVDEYQRSVQKRLELDGDAPLILKGQGSECDPLPGDVPLGGSRPSEPKDSAHAS